MGSDWSDCQPETPAPLVTSHTHEPEDLAVVVRRCRSFADSTPTPTPLKHDFVLAFGSPTPSRLCLHCANADAAQPPRFGPCLRCSNAVTTITGPRSIAYKNTKDEEAHDVDLYYVGCCFRQEDAAATGVDF
ncbi:hypothetical protein PIB30_049639 [Stylosanthes scabra]|uniref:Uncharacterized protein n=1 Tax=Stylosanthes scabra TaxID=79078 RepID=A0ABU6QI09_9FABA|nr:hypothetical protein [Stylosanthes scabra]